MNDTSSVINNSAQSILAICSVLLNFLLILVCGKSKVITKNFANYTIIQTAIADLIYCIGILALILSETSLSYSITKGHSALNHCVIILGALFYGYQIRDITVVFITIDRWAALKYPVFFRKISLKVN
uniref:G_PROTEIN_RECEP_F1_2 domain-containing protein n=1 Tax=Parastrongyloides trichosuri TaxID=131310 RepID=A0A0N4ZK13_PARTI